MTALPPFSGRASWVWSGEGSHEELPAGQGSPSHYQVRRFRLAWQLPAGETLAGWVQVSADSRYVLHCNGRLVGRGPAKGDIHHHFYDTHDLTPFLVEGMNVLAALVWDMSSVAHRPHKLGAPGSIMTYAGGFLLEGDAGGGGRGVVLDTGSADWRVAVDRAYRFQNEGTRFEGYHGYFEERIDGELPQGWMEAGYDDSTWTPATVLYAAERRENRRDPASPYGLIARIIPPLAEGPDRSFATGFRPGGACPPAEWGTLLRDGADEGGVVIPPQTEIAVICDTGRMTTGYPLLVISGGDGAVVRLTYAEALRLPWDTPGARLLGRRQSLENLASHFADEATGWTFDRRGTIQGWCDLWRPAGGHSDYTPLHWRAFRFVELCIRTADEPLVLHRLGYRFAAYPFEIKATFACSDAGMNRLWETGLHTMRLCSHETFEDCPHYEQMQYAGDTMITSHLAMLASGDHRLSKQALLHFDWSRIPEGLTQSRYPSRLLQVIPSWSLHWITAVRDYGLCSGDLELVREVLPGMNAVLDWFRRQTDASGLPAKLPYWNITDWCPWWPRGVVPGADEGPTCIIASQWIQALAEVAEMCRWLERDAEAQSLEAEAVRLRGVVHQTFWSEDDGLYRDRPGGTEVSQYGNAWAVAVGAADEATCGRLRERFPRDPALAPGSFFAWHTIFKAMRRMGTYATMPDCLGPWRESVALGLDTFVEENSYWRSLCHAWSAHPALEFLQHVLGVQATAPGFARLRIAPQPCGLDWAEGRVCTPRGFVTVSWRVRATGWTMVIDTPPHTPVEIVLPDGTTHRSAGGRWGIGEDTP